MEKQECCNISELVQEFHQGISQFIRLKITDTEDAEDLVQEVMLKLVRAHAENKAVSNIKNWLYTVTNNTIADYYRKKYKENDLNQNYLLENSFELIDSQALEISDFIVPMIKLLDEKYSKPLLLSDIEGMPQKEIANMLQLSLPAVKSRIQRGRKLLRALFFECWHIQLDANQNIVSCKIKHTCTPLIEIEKQLKNKEIFF